MEITRERVEQRLADLRNEQMLILEQAAALLGRIQECETLLKVLETPEPEEVVKPHVVGIEPSED